MTDLFTQPESALMSRIKQTAELLEQDKALGIGNRIYSLKQKLKPLIEQWEKENKRVNREEQKKQVKIYRIKYLKGELKE